MGAAPRVLPAQYLDETRRDRGRKARGELVSRFFGAVFFPSEIAQIFFFTVASTRRACCVLLCFFFFFLVLVGLSLFFCVFFLLVHVHPPALRRWISFHSSLRGPSGKPISFRSASSSIAKDSSSIFSLASSALTSSSTPSASIHA